MEPGSIAKIVGLVVLVWLSSFFSASEMALMSLSKIRLRSMVEDGVKNADKIAKMLEKPSQLLGGILVGNNLVNICSSSIATALAIQLSPANGVGIATIVMTVVLLIFGEITPKTLAQQNAEKYALMVIRPISAAVTVLRPVVFVLNGITGALVRLLGGNKGPAGPTVTEAELKTMVDVSREEGVLTRDKQQMLNNVFDFSTTKAKDVMTPRTDMVALPLTATYAEIIETFQKERFSRIPIYKEDIDDIVGVLYLKDVAFVPEADFSMEDCLREVLFTYESKSTTALFNQMRTTIHPIAIVLDEYGGTSGLITMEDLVEEIVGDIADEFDQDEEEIHRVRDNEYLVAGSLRLDDLNEYFDKKLESKEVDTLGGYITEQMGRFPTAGEMWETDGLRMVVEEVDKNRVEKVRIFT